MPQTNFRTPHTRRRIHVLPNGHKVHLQGWKPDKPDHRDAHYARPMVSQEEAAALAPTFLDQRPEWASKLQVFNQGKVGDCTANGTVETGRWIFWKAKQTEIPQFSRLFQYAECRKAEGTPLTEDSGCSIRDAVRTAHDVGLCPEELWPSDNTDRFVLDPTDDCRKAAAEHRIESYHQVPNLLALKREIANWYPVIFGFTVYESMMSDMTAKTGLIPIPQHDENVDGGHCIIAVGWDNTKVISGQRGAVLCLNSWGTEWGDGGFCWMPYFFFNSGLASDMWVVYTEMGVCLP